jgi:Phage integrase family
MPRSVHRKLYAISPPIIDCMNSPESERRFQQLRTIAFYSSATSKPRWGDRRLGAVRTMEVEEWLHSLPLAPSSKAKLKCVLSTLYHHAIRYEWLTFNPISRPRTSQRRLRDKDVLTPEEFQALVQQLSVRDRAMVLLIGSTGLRRSEMIALTWSDLSMCTMEVNVLRSCVRNGSVRRRQMHLAARSFAPRRPPCFVGVAPALVLCRSSGFPLPSVRFKGNEPLSPDSILEKSVRPALAWIGVVGKRIG